MKESQGKSKREIFMFAGKKPSPIWERKKRGRRKKFLGELLAFIIVPIMPATGTCGGRRKKNGNGKRGKLQLLDTKTSGRKPPPHIAQRALGGFRLKQGKRVQKTFREHHVARDAAMRGLGTPGSSEIAKEGKSKQIKTPYFWAGA